MINTLERALTLMFAVWVGGNIREVPPQWCSEHWMLDEPQNTTMVLFLGKLCCSADFHNSHAQQIVLDKLDQILAAMQQNQAFQEHILHLIDLPLTSCVDTITQVFNDVCLALTMHRLTSETKSLSETGQALNNLGLGLIRLNAVRDVAFQFSNAHIKLDQVEVMLKVEVLLTKRLDLPVVSRDWLFADRIYLPEQVLENAICRAERAERSSSTVDAFFEHWQPWQTYLRKKMAASCPYSALPEKTWLGEPKDLIDMTCAITLNRYGELIEPVAMGRRGKERIFEYSELLKWYFTSDKHPITRETFDMTSMYRLRPIE